RKGCRLKYPGRYSRLISRHSQQPPPRTGVQTRADSSAQARGELECGDDGAYWSNRKPGGGTPERGNILRTQVFAKEDSGRFRTRKIGNFGPEPARPHDRQAARAPLRFGASDSGAANFD